MRRLRRITLTALALAWLLPPRRPPGPRAVSSRAAEWAMVGSEAEMRADAIIAELFKTCKRTPQQMHISYMNGRIAKDKWEARLEVWREHFGILAEVADGLGRRR